MNVPVIMQMHTGENGLAVLAMMLAYYKKYVTFEELRKTCVFSRNGMELKDLANSAQRYGLNTEVISCSADELKDCDFPIAVLWKKKYYCIVRKIRRKMVYVTDPAKGEYTITYDRFQELFSGQAIKFSKGESFVPGGRIESSLSLIYKRIANYKYTLILTVILNSLAVALGTYQIVVRKALIDDVMVGGNKLRFLPLMILMIAIAVIVFLLNSLKLVQLYKVSRRMAADAGSKLFKRLFAMPIRFYEQNSKGELLERIESNISFDNSLISSLVPKVVNSIMTFFYFALMINYNLPVAIACIGLEILFMLVSFLLQRRNAIIQRSINASSGAMNTSLLNGLSVIETIKATGSERIFFGMWSKAQQGYQENQHSTLRINSLLSFVGSIHRIVVSAILLFVGAYLIIRGEITLGMLSAFQAIYNNMSASLESMLSTAGTIQKMRTTIERIEDINRREVIKPVPIPEGEDVDKLRGIIKVDNVSFSYNNGDGLVLSNINFDLNQGEMIALVGASGCGKSTLMKIISGMYKPTEGNVFYDGKKRDEIPDVVFNSSIACVNQEIMLFEDSIENNIKMWDDTVADFEMILAARDAQIHERIAQEIGGYKAMVCEGGRNFSGGEKQCLELARALAIDTSTLLLDEFTAAMDSITEKKVFDSIRRKGVSCIIAAHRLSTVAQCDRILVMEHGKIVEDGTHEELLKAGGVYSKLIEVH